MNDRFLLAIPVFNEERYLNRVLDEALQYCEHVLVINDGSTDATADLLKRRRDVAIVSHAENRGYDSPANEYNSVGFRVAEVSEQAAPIPTVSQWGLSVMALLVLTAGTLVYARRGAAMA